MTLTNPWKTLKIIDEIQPYLTAVTTKYKQWWQLYTLTDAESKKQQSQDVTPIFDFGLIVQRVKKEEREQRQYNKVE